MGKLTRVQIKAREEMLAFFPGRLKEALDNCGMNKNQLAIETGLSRQMLTEYANGRKLPTMGSMGVIAEKLGTTTDWLLGLDRETKPWSDCESVRMMLGKPEILTQIAEEAGELAQAALKLRRAMTGVNPTPLPEGAAWQDLLEEIGDLWNAIDALDIEVHNPLIDVIRKRKMQRWAKRLEDKGE